MRISECCSGSYITENIGIYQDAELAIKKAASIENIIDEEEANDIIRVSVFDDDKYLGNLVNVTYFNK